MRIQLQRYHDLYILRLSGRFVTGSDSAYSTTRDELQSRAVSRLVVNFRDVPYIDSTGISFVVGLHNMLESSGGRLVLAEVNSRVREILKLTRLDQTIPIFSDQESAIAALEKAKETVLAAARP